MKAELVDIIISEVRKLSGMGLTQNQIRVLKESMTGIALSSYELGNTGKLKEYRISENDNWDDESEFY